MAAAYEVHLRGELSQEVLDELEGASTRSVPAETVLSGVVPDQAALVGLLNRLQALGLELIEVRTAPCADGSP